MIVRVESSGWKLQQQTKLIQVADIFQRPFMDP